MKKIKLHDAVRKAILTFKTEKVQYLDIELLESVIYSYYDDSEDWCNFRHEFFELLERGYLDMDDCDFIVYPSGIIEILEDSKLHLRDGWYDRRGCAHDEDIVQEILDKMDEADNIVNQPN